MNCQEITTKCTKCGNCCRSFAEERGVILFPRDFDIIPHELHLSIIDFKNKYCSVQSVYTKSKKIKLYSLRFHKGECVFLKDNGLCGIYEVRPIQCQRAPFYFFWDGKLDDVYECYKNIQIPINWTSTAIDNELLNSLFND